MLVIPTDHIESLNDDVSGSLLAEMRTVAASVAADEGLEGWRLVSNVGAAAGQSVFHLHFHVLGGRPLSWPPG